MLKRSMHMASTLTVLHTPGKPELNVHSEGPIRWKLPLTLERFAPSAKAKSTQSASWARGSLKFSSTDWQICAPPDPLRILWQEDHAYWEAKTTSTWLLIYATVTDWFFVRTTPTIQLRNLGN
jgi:hypothetical protein